MNSEIVKEVVEITLQDIERVLSFDLAEIDHYWLRYSKEVPQHMRASISRYIFQQTQAKVLWITGEEVKIELC